MFCWHLASRCSRVNAWYWYAQFVSENNIEHGVAFTRHFTWNILHARVPWDATRSSQFFFHQYKVMGYDCKMPGAARSSSARYHLSRQAVWSLTLGDMFEFWIATKGKPKFWRCTIVLCCIYIPYTILLHSSFSIGILFWSLFGGNHMHPLSEPP